MTYASLLLEDGIESNYLAVIKPRRLIDSTAWTVVSGTKYTTPFAWGDGVVVEADGVVKTQAASVSVGSGEWFWDYSTNLLTVDFGADPDTMSVVVTYEIHLATKGCHWNRIPTDSTSRIVYFEPLIKSAPKISTSMSDVLFGIMATQSSSMECDNSEAYFEQHVYDSSFYNADVDLYHWLSDLEATNLKLVYKFLVQNVFITNSSCSFDVMDRYDLFSKNYRNYRQREVDALQFYPEISSLPEMDPNFVGRPVRAIFGRVDGLPCVNLAYGSTNDMWAVCGWWGSPSFYNTVKHIIGTSSTTSRFYLDDVSGIGVGDQWNLPNSYGLNKVCIIAAVGADYVDVTSAKASPPVAGETFTWSSAKEYNLDKYFHTTTVSGSSSTTTRTNVASAAGYNVGDWVYIKVGVFEAAKITGVNTTATPNYLDHSTISSGASAGAAVRRHPVAAVYRIHDGITTELALDAEWEPTMLESSVSFPIYGPGGSVIPLFVFVGTDPASEADTVFCRVYGPKNDVTMSGSPFGSDSSQFGCLTNGVVILFDLLKRGLGIPESDIDLAAFAALEPGADEIGMAVPEMLQSDFPTYREVIARILSTLGMRLFVGDDGKWTISKIVTIGTVDKTLTEDEIVDGSFSCEFDHSDLISTAIVEYDGREVDSKNQVGGEPFYLRANATSSTAQYLHHVTKQRTFRTCHIIATQAAAFAKKLIDIFGERRGKATVQTKHRFLDSEVGNVIKIQRERMPGYSLVDGTTRDRSFVLTSLEKGLSDATLELDDQKGITDHVGDF